MKKGICCICGEYKELTFEHIPPNKAFNYCRAKSIEGAELLKLITEKNRMPWETDGLKYVPKQRGMGIYSLCEKCNNITGSYYGTEYLKFANTIDMLFPQIISNNTKNNNNVANIIIHDMNPLLFAKQVLSMFCSTCPNITKMDPTIKNLLLNKEKKGLNQSKYKLSMFLLSEHKIGYTGYQVMHISGLGIRKLATIDAYPFGFVLEFDPIENLNSPELDITSFFNDYDCTEYKMEFGIPVLERNNIISCDYRTKPEIKKCFYDN